MEWLHQFELAWILLIQSFGVWLVTPMRLISTVGNEEFFLIVMPILYWSVDSALGLRVAVILLFSNGINAAVKLAVHSSRPYWISQDIQAYSTEQSFGFPSGHAQIAAGIWGYIATRLHSPRWRIFLVVLIFLIGFSRVFLGVHFISDVAAGWAIGGLIVLLVTRLERPVGAWLSRQSLRDMLLTALISALLLGGMVILSAAATHTWQVPAEWNENALKADPNTPINPFSIDPVFTTTGVWLGLWAGLAWRYHRRGEFQASGSYLQRLLRYLIGLAGVFLFWYVLGKIFPRDMSLLSYLLRFLRYLLVGLWITGLSTYLFEALKLSPMPTKPQK